MTSSEEELLRTLATFKATLESTSEAILATDELGNITQSNLHFYEMWNVPPGTNHRQMLPDMAKSLKDPAIYVAVVDDIYTSAPEESRDLLEFKDGRVIERITKIQRIEGRNVGRVWSYRDLTERVLSEESRSRLAAVVESSDDAIISKTLEGVITTWNAGAERIFGYTAAEVIGKSITILIPNELLHEEPTILGRIKSGDRIDHYETERVGKNGARLVVSLTVSPVRDSTGKIVGVSKIARDITEQRREIKERERVEAALRESEQHLRAMFNQAAVGIAEAELNGRFTQVNTKFSEILGYSPEELMELTFKDLTHPDDLVETITLTDQLISGNAGHHSYEKRYIRKDGSVVWALATITLLEDDEGKPRQLVSVIEDISARKQVELAKQELLESERAARMEAEKLSRLKDEFLATLSHELRTPLNAILGWTYIIGQKPDDESMVREGIEVVERNARTQTQLVADLLDMSRIISGKMRLDVQQVQLPELVEAAIESVLPSADAKGVRVEVILDPVGDIVHGDPNRIQQIVWNLLSNAVKFTPRDGKIQVVLHRINSHVEISVSDTGKGIRADFLPYLFERFSQQDSSAAREHGGLGIGLALVKQLTELHGGKVRAHSPGENKGSTFVIEIPLAAVRPFEEEAGPRLHPTSNYEGPGGGDLPSLEGLKILIVDDEPDGRAILRRILEEVGANVTTAGSADEGYSVLVATHPDILVSDIGMPGQDGYEFIRRVRKAGYTMPAMALTAFARSSDRTRALLAGFQTHIGKPVEPVELLVTVASLIASRGPR